MGTLACICPSHTIKWDIYLAFQECRCWNIQGPCTVWDTFWKCSSSIATTLTKLPTRVKYFLEAMLTPKTHRDMDRVGSAAQCPNTWFFLHTYTHTVKAFGAHSYTLWHQQKVFFLPIIGGSSPKGSAFSHSMQNSLTGSLAEVVAYTNHKSKSTAFGNLVITICQVYGLHKDNSLALSGEHFMCLCAILDFYVIKPGGQTSHVGCKGDDMG